MQVAVDPPRTADSTRFLALLHEALVVQLRWISAAGVIQMRPKARCFTYCRFNPRCSNRSAKSTSSPPWTTNCSSYPLTRIASVRQYAMLQPRVPRARRSVEEKSHERPRERRRNLRCDNLTPQENGPRRIVPDSKTRRVALGESSAALSLDKRVCLGDAAMILNEKSICDHVTV